MAAVCSENITNDECGLNVEENEVNDMNGYDEWITTHHEEFLEYNNKMFENDWYEIQEYVY